MSIQLTKSQQAVVDDTGGALLVSAAAGSGKTRVLVERLFRHIFGEEQANVDEFLIITYTRAAATELRERIAQELTERTVQYPNDRHLQRQLMLVYQAEIKTIDGFCTSFLRENIHLLQLEGERGLTADFRVIDESEAELLRRRVLPRVLEEFYANLTEGGKQLADAFGFGRNDQMLEELVFELYSKIQSHAYPEVWLAEQKVQWQNIPENVGDSIYGRELLCALARKTRHWITMLRKGMEQMREDSSLMKNYAPVFEEGVIVLEMFARRLDKGWDAAAAASLNFPNLKAVRSCTIPERKEQLKLLWNRCKEEMSTAREILNVSAVDGAADLRDTAPAIEALLDLCMAFSKAYRTEKLRRNVADFSDQEHYAVELLYDREGHKTPLAYLVAQRYREIMVDEYQDTNQVQNCIFSAISQEGKNLFTVGDVKQSIYRFRLADPTIFLDKYLHYPYAEQAAEGEPRKILLSQNFRSRKSVLDATNFIFRAIMSQEMGEMDYGEEEQLNFGASYLPSRTDCAAEFHLVHVPRGGEEKAAMAEARFVAYKIHTLLEEGFPVTEGDTMRPCRPEDIVVLMRSPATRMSYYVRAFEEYHIPCALQKSDDFFAAMEVAVVYALLQILDNPRQDIPLLSVLRSPLFGFSPDRLAMIRGKHPKGDFYDALVANEDEDCQAFCAKLHELRTRAKDMSVHRLLWHLYNTFHVLGVFGAMSNGTQRRENLITLYEHAKNFEAAGYKGLFSFVSHLRFMMENGQTIKQMDNSSISGVRIMTIHRSKGLEFPIVILADLNRMFSNIDLQKPVLVHPDLGLGPYYIDLSRRIRYPTMAREAVSRRISREMRSEEMRLLYVAMTRAKEKLIMVASMTSVTKKLTNLMALSSLPVPPETVDSAKSMAEWILLPLLQRYEAYEYRIMTGAGEEQYAVTHDTPWIIRLHEGTGECHRETDEEAQTRCEEKQYPDIDIAALSYRYPYRAACFTPTKLTATQVKGRVIDEEISEQMPYVRSEFAAPRFLSGERSLTAAQRGTATHLVLQYLPLDGDVDTTVMELVYRHLLTAEQAMAIDKRALRNFLHSPLADELRRADRVEREFPFSILVNASEYYWDMAEDEQVLLQGVVDLFAETEQGILIVDFKTDYVTEDTIQERIDYYRPQVETYSNALEKILEKKVIRRVLYFLRTGQSAEI